MPTPDAVDEEATGKQKRRRWPKVLLVIGIVMGVAIAGTAAAGAYLYSRFNGNITVVENVETVGPPQENEPLNVLLMGSDKRTGKGNRGYGLDSGRNGQRSDTTILLHLSADRSRALAVSIPRDTWVEMPECAGGGGYSAKFNNAFDAGGPACTTKLVQQMTGIGINHIAVVDFGGFKEMINALDGVEICLERPVNDPDSKLNLPAGNHIVKDEEALAFVRARKTIGDGSDLSRIKRQQAFLSSAIRKVTDTQLLLNPVKLFRVLDTATKSLSVDKELKDVSAMRDLAESVRSIDPKDITFLTMPNQWRDAANVEEDKEKTTALWQAIKDDSPWPPPVSRAADGEKAVIDPSLISVHIINASGSPKAGKQSAKRLQKLGFQSVTLNQQGGSTQDSRVEFPTGRKDSARTVSAATSLPMKQSGQVSQVTIVLGSDWNGQIAKSLVIGKKPVPGVISDEPTTADEKICAG